MTTTPAKTYTLVAGLVAVLVAVSWLIQWHIAAATRAEVEKGLNVVLHSRVAMLNSWEKSLRESAQRLARALSTAEFAASIEAAAYERGPLADSALTVMSSYLLKNALQAGMFKDYLILSMDGIVLASSDVAEVGNRPAWIKSSERVREATMRGEPVVSHPVRVSRFESSMFVVAPFVVEGGAPVGMLALRFDPLRQFSGLFERTQMGLTGETYALNRDGLMLSGSRFSNELIAAGLLESEERSSLLSVEIRDPGVDLTTGAKASLPRYQQPLTQMAASVVRGETQKNLFGYRDYRGVEVVGTWTWLDSLELGITSELDYEEAYAVLRETQFVITAWTAGVALLLFILAVVFTRSKRGVELLNVELKDRVKEVERQKDALRKSEEQFQAVFDHASIGMVVFGADARVAQASRSYLKVCGRDAQDVLGQHANRCLHTEDRANAREKFELMQCGELDAYEAEARFTRPDGSDVWAEIRAGSVRDADGKLLNVIAGVTDISQRKKADAELQRARRYAEEASNAKSDFLANMSHEIRTPMNAIIGLAHLARKTELTAQQADYLRKIEAAGRNLLGIINDILDFSKIEAGKLEMERTEFDLNQVLDDMATVVGTKAAEKQLEILFDVSADVPYGLVGDPLRLSQILINFANNAVKFTEEGYVRLNIERVASTESDVTLKFSVQDTGIGMNEDQVERLFQSFAQADTSTTRRYGGSGLGLVISKKLAEMMNGEVGVASKPGAGSTFWATAQFGLHDKILRVLALHPDLIGARVLVVDDNAASRQVFRSYLQGFGLEVEEAASGEAGLAAVRRAANERNAYGLVLSDMGMPGLDGLEFAARIHSDLELEQPPRLIIATAQGPEAIVDAAKKVGVEHVLAKPVGQSQLFDALMRVYGYLEKAATMTLPALGPTLSGKVRGAHLLLVEDNDVNQQVAQEILSDAGVRVSIANHGAEALEMLDAQRFDGVLMDLQMPVMDGYTASEEIRKQARFAELPILAMSADAMTRDKERAAAAGMNEHIAKPIDVAELFSMLEKWITVAGHESTGVDARTLPIGGSQTELTNVTAGEDAAADYDTLAGFDVSGALKRLNNSDKLYRKILSKFRAGQASALEVTRTAFEQEDFEAAQRAAHTLKGVAGNIGALALQESAAALESAIKQRAQDVSGELAACESQLAHALEVVGRFEGAALADNVPRRESSSDEADATLLRPLIQALREQLDSADAEATATADRLTEHLGLDARVGAIVEAIEGYDYDVALAQVDELEQELGFAAHS